jgi:hypothetical protein
MDNEHEEDDEEEDNDKDNSEIIDNIPHNTSAQSIILRQIPFLIPFADRVQLLQQLVYRSEGMLIIIIMVIHSVMFI